MVVRPGVRPDAPLPATSPRDRIRNPLLSINRHRRPGAALHPRGRSLAVQMPMAERAIGALDLVAQRDGAAEAPSTTPPSVPGSWKPSWQGRCSARCVPSPRSSANGAAATGPGAGSASGPPRIMSASSDPARPTARSMTAWRPAPFGTGSTPRRRRPRRRLSYNMRTDRKADAMSTRSPK
jgi:hypothetical protein